MIAIDIIKIIYYNLKREKINKVELLQKLEEGKIKPNSLIQVDGYSYTVEEIGKYVLGDSTWFNLTCCSAGFPKEYIIVEIAEKVRIWEKVEFSKKLTTEIEKIRYKKKTYKCIEKSNAIFIFKTEIEPDEEEEGNVLYSILVTDPDDINDQGHMLSIEEIDGKVTTYHSNKTIPFHSIHIE